MALIKCSRCGQLISDKAERCPKCGDTDSGIKTNTTYENASVHWGWFILALFFPFLADFIIYFVQKEKNPSMAKAMYYGGWINLVIYILWYLI